MGVIDKLNALDDRAGVSRSAAARMWPRWVRLWWIGLALAYGLAIASLAVALFGKVYLFSSAFAMLPAVFWSGFLYNDRMRSLGRRPRLMSVPPTWPDETT